MAAFYTWKDQAAGEVAFVFDISANGNFEQLQKPGDRKSKKTGHIAGLF